MGGNIEIVGIMSTRWCGMQGWNRGTRKRRKGEEEKRIKAEKWEKM